ncbi:MAG: LytR C-terminal domain-containing protein [Nocardioides sp.]
MAPHPVGRSPRRGYRHDQRGLVFPSPVTVLSIVAVTMAGVAFFATRHHDAPEPAATPAAHHSTGTQTKQHQPKQHHVKQRPTVDRSKVLVEVFNNSQVTGLAAKVGSRASQLGWQVVGADDWYGTIPASTVYYPPQLAKAARQMALDLGIHRTMPAVTPMRLDRLTVILTGPLATH